MKKIDQFEEEIVFTDISEIYDEVEAEELSLITDEQSAAIEDEAAEPVLITEESPAVTGEEDVSKSAPQDSPAPEEDTEGQPDEVLAEESTAFPESQAEGGAVPGDTKEDAGKDSEEDQGNNTEENNGEDGGKETGDGGEKEGGPRRKLPWKKIFTISALAAAACAVTAYGYGVYYYTSHFLPGSIAEGVVIENLTAEEASAKLTASKIPEDSRFALTTKDGEKVEFGTAPLNIRRTYRNMPEALKEQDKWTFFFKKDELKTLSFPYDVTFDREGVEEALSGLDICDPEKTDPPADSYVYKDEKTGIYNVAEPADGNTIDIAILSEAVAVCVERKCCELDIQSTGAYLTAAVREDDPELLKNAKMENAFEAAELTLLMGDGVERKITPDELRGMISEGVDENTPFGSVIDREKLRELVDKIGRSYTTKSASGFRYFKSITGTKKAMPTDYGWDMDEDGTEELLFPMLEEVVYSICVNEIVHYDNPRHTVEAAWSQKAVSHGERDTGDSWVEVDLTNQKVYCIVENQLVLETDCVTGLDRNKGRRTPRGFYKITFKTTERDLVGYNPDGTESYRSHVHYWMPFNKNIGLHDATWRWKFGGTIYKYDGSHGCVNMPLKAARELYGYVYKDMPVIVYK